MKRFRIKIFILISSVNDSPVTNKKRELDKSIKTNLHDCAGVAKLDLLNKILEHRKSEFVNQNGRGKRSLNVRPVLKVIIVVTHI